MTHLLRSSSQLWTVRSVLDYSDYQTLSQGKECLIQQNPFIKLKRLGVKDLDILLLLDSLERRN